VGQRHKCWKGDAASYKAKHQWVARILGRPRVCQECGRTVPPRGHETDQKYFQWANISGHYLRIVEDWKRLCAACHGKFDRHLRRHSKTPKTNTSGEKNIHWYKRNRKWGVRVGLGGKHVFLGLFLTKEGAVKARDAYLKTL